MYKRILVCVTNDLVTDQRVHKVCSSLMLHYPKGTIILLGRKKRNSLPLEKRNYLTHRMKLVFEFGFFFYAEYTIRLFFYILFSRTSLIVSNDLDTLLPCYLASLLKRKKLVYDSHEIFTEVPELENRLFVKKCWENIEGFIFPKLKNVYTVNNQLADYFTTKYKVPVSIVRNVPMEPCKTATKLSRNDLRIDPNNFLVIYQGSLNKDRGLEELIDSFALLPSHFSLLIVGSGDLENALKKRATNNKAIVFAGEVPFQELLSYTRLANLGVSLEKMNNLNYAFALPNKFFDYIHAGIPVLVSPLIAYKEMLSKYDLGFLIESHHPSDIATAIKRMENTPKTTMEINRFKHDFNWRREEKTLNDIYTAIY
jgi:glycosyltransferase involved in cell wall biosynthesis